MTYKVLLALIFNFKHVEPQASWLNRRFRRFQGVRHRFHAHRPLEPPTARLAVHANETGKNHVKSKFHVLLKRFGGTHAHPPVEGRDNHHRLSGSCDRHDPDVISTFKVCGIGFFLTVHMSIDTSNR